MTIRWNPLPYARRAISALRKPPAPPPINLSAVLKAAREADTQRAIELSELGQMRVMLSRLSERLEDVTSSQDYARQQYVERATELVEARQMAGSGPWLVAESREKLNDPRVTGKELRESSPISSQGAYGDVEFALQNVSWRREINLSWLEFSRWGIQQIILISRLYYIKNPIIRRLIDVASQYVFARGVEVSSPDPDANEVLQNFFERNRSTLGQIALTQHERSKYTDGNLFFVFFPDVENTGEVNVRTIDATEIQDIICDPDDADQPWYYRRAWTQRSFDPVTGTVGTQSIDAWYPALGWDPESPNPTDSSPQVIALKSRPDKIGDIPVRWDNPVYHRKCGTVAKWHFGCPLIYPALDWAREARRFLEACASVMQALSQIALKITTKGGQQALAGVKQQMGSTVGPSTPLWDNNPPAVPGATFASGPGTTLEAFKTTGAGQDPEKVRQYKLMCTMVVGVPETFLGDVSTGNLATATTLDRPTELVFLERQEAWREDLVAIGKYVLSVSARANNGALREAMGRRQIDSSQLEFREVARILLPTGRWMYVEEKARRKMSRPSTVEVKCIFPSIREGDIPQLVGAVTMAMTLGNKMGTVVGIDEKAGITMLLEYLGYEDAAELAEEMYPEAVYDPERKDEPLPIPGQPGVPAIPGQVPPKSNVVPPDQEDDDEEKPPPAVPAGSIAVKAHSRKSPSKKLKEAVDRLISAMEAKEAAMDPEEKKDSAVA